MSRWDPGGSGDSARRNHEQQQERMRKRQAEADQRIADQAAARAASEAQIALQRRQLREEVAHNLRQDERERLANQQGRRRHLKAIGISWSLEDRKRWLDEVLAECVTPNDPIVRQLDAWLTEIERREGIERILCTDPRLHNGGASRAGRFILSAPRLTIRQCCTDIHEVGHVLHPDLADDRFIELGGRRISVPREVAAWQWGLDRVPVWTADMHEELVSALATYRKFAIPSEMETIDRLCSRLTLLETRQRILERSIRRS
jgi:hypothetical protein